MVGRAGCLAHRSRQAQVMTFRSAKPLVWVACLAPLLWLVQDENGNWVRMVFSVEAYYRYIVEKYLERA